MWVLRDADPVLAVSLMTVMVGQGVFSRSNTEPCKAKKSPTSATKACILSGEGSKTTDSATVARLLNTCKYSTRPPINEYVK